MKNPKLVIGIVAILVLLIIFYIIYKNSKKVVVVKSGTTVTQPSLLDTLSNAFFPKPKTGTDTTTSASTPIYCKIFPKLCDDIKCRKNDAGFKCDENKPGWNCDGIYDNNCQS